MPCIYQHLLSAEELAGIKTWDLGDIVGVTARPFVPHHNALDIDMYLRIAPELYLKRVVVGGFERVFEINRNFRNESLSTRRNPAFTVIEFYQAYADYNDMMEIYKFLFMNIILKRNSYDRINDTARWL